MSNSPPLVILNGIFQSRSPADVLVYPPQGETISVSDRLSHLVGKRVDIVMHHFPPEGRLEESAGGGSCLLGPYCHAGHREDPAFLFSQKLFGVLSSQDGALMVGQIPLDFASLNGHFGRLVAFALPSIEGAGLDELLAEAASMSDLLTSLRTTLKGET